MSDSKESKSGRFICSGGVFRAFNQDDDHTHVIANLAAMKLHTPSHNVHQGIDPIQGYLALWHSTRASCSVVKNRLEFTKLLKVLKVHKLSGAGYGCHALLMIIIRIYNLSNL